MKNIAINNTGVHVAEAVRPDRLLAPVAPARPSDDRPQDEISQGPLAKGADSQGLSLSRHSFTLSTNRFSLDYTHQRMEVLPGAEAQPRAKTRTAQPSPARTKAAPPTKTEVLRRAKLAELLTSPHPSRREGSAWGPEPGPASASPQAACRSYVTAARGSTRGDHYFEA